MKKLTLCFIALVLFLSASPAHAQAPTTLDDYRRVVQETLALVQQANRLVSSERAPLLNQAADKLNAVRAVQTPSGAQIPIDNHELVALIRNSAKTQAAVNRLAALQLALAQPLATVKDADILLLRDILSRPPFQQTVADVWYAEIVRAILKFIDRLFSNTARGVFELRDVFVLVGVIVVIAVLIYFVRNLRRNLVAEEELPPPLHADDARTPAEAFDNAQRFLNAGDYRSAVRQLYLATLLLLDQRGRIKYDPTLTNREYLRQASKDPRAVSALQPIVETFDRTWYGFEPISRQEFDEYKQRVEQVREL